MMAITVWQPWASLIAMGLKPYEFRGWAPPRAMIGKRIGIHAGARPVKPPEVKDLLLQLQRGDKGAALRPEAAAFLQHVLASNSLPRSQVVCTAILGEPIRATELPPEWADSDRADHHTFGWPMLEVEYLMPPEPARGAQGFWRWKA